MCGEHTQIQPRGEVVLGGDRKGAFSQAEIMLGKLNFDPRRRSGMEETVLTPQNTHTPLVYTHHTPSHKVGPRSFSFCRYTIGKTTKSPIRLDQIPNGVCRTSRVLDSFNPFTITLTKYIRRHTAKIRIKSIFLIWIDSLIYRLLTPS